LLQETTKCNISNKSKNILGIDPVEQFMQRTNDEVSPSYYVIVELIISRHVCKSLELSAWL